MKLKKINAALGLISIVTMLVHIGYTDYAYLAFYYNPMLKRLTALPFMIVVCLHAVCGMAAVFLQSDGTRMDLYPKQNLKTIIQRLTAALILPLLFLHIKTYDLLRSSAEGGQWLAFALLMLSQPLSLPVPRLDLAGMAFVPGGTGAAGSDRRCRRRRAVRHNGVCRGEGPARHVPEVRWDS